MNPQLSYTFVTAAELTQIKACPVSQITQYSSFSFAHKRDDSTSLSYLDYYDLGTQTDERFIFTFSKFTL